MTRSRFLTGAATVALLVGSVAVVFPRALLESKGVAITDAVVVWVREVGVMIASQGILTLLVRREPDSRALRAIFVASALVQLGLFPIELVAYQAGIITLARGVVPNTLLHAFLGTAFAVLAARVRVEAPRSARMPT